MRYIPEVGATTLITHSAMFSDVPALYYYVERFPSHRRVQQLLHRCTVKLLELQASTRAAVFPHAKLIARLEFLTLSPSVNKYRIMNTAQRIVNLRAMHTIHTSYVYACTYLWSSISDSRMRTTFVTSLRIVPFTGAASWALSTPFILFLQSTSGASREQSYTKWSSTSLDFDHTPIE
jgi:hypothetical protein